MGLWWGRRQEAFNSVLFYLQAPAWWKCREIMQACDWLRDPSGPLQRLLLGLARVKLCAAQPQQRCKAAAESSVRTRSGLDHKTMCRIRSQDHKQHNITIDGNEKISTKQQARAYHGLGDCHNVQIVQTVIQILSLKLLLTSVMVRPAARKPLVVLPPQLRNHARKRQVKSTLSPGKWSLPSNNILASQRQHPSPGPALPFKMDQSSPTYGLHGPPKEEWTWRNNSMDNALFGAPKTAARFPCHGQKVRCLCEGVGDHFQRSQHKIQ